MNKMFKGSIVGAAGVAVLMGGFGTFALWSDSETFDTHAVEAGELSITAGTATLVDQTGATWTSGDRLVPGDTLTLTQPVTVTAEGKNLSGRLVVTTPTLSGDLAAHVTVTTTINDGAFVSDASTVAENDFTFSTGNLAAEPVSVVTTFTLAESVDGLVAQTLAGTISATTITVSQDDPTPA